MLNTKSKKTLLIFVATIASLSYVIYWAKVNIPTQAELCKQGVKFYRSKDFQGRVIKKFINEDQRFNKTIIIRRKYDKKTVLLNADIGGVYDYLTVGDSVVKNYGELFVLVNRNGNDTIINFKFRCY